MTFEKSVCVLFWEFLTIEDFWEFLFLHKPGFFRRISRISQKSALQWSEVVDSVISWLFRNFHMRDLFRRVSHLWQNFSKVSATVVSDHCVDDFWEICMCAVLRISDYWRILRISDYWEFLTIENFWLFRISAMCSTACCSEKGYFEIAQKSANY